MDNPINKLKKLLTHLEMQCTKTAKKYNIENLSGPQGMVILYLYKNKDKEIFVKDIEKKFSITKSVASNLIKRMEKNNFIEIIPSQKDKRYKQVILTSSAEEKIPNLIAFKEDIHSMLAKDIPKEDWLVTERTFKQLAKNINYKEDTNV